MTRPAWHEGVGTGPRPRPNIGTLRKRRVGALLLGGLALVLACRPNAAWSAVKPPAQGAGLRRLTVGGPSEMPPYAFLDPSGIYTGYSVEILRAAGELLGVENVLFYPGHSAENLKALNQGTLDCVHFLRYTPELAEDYLYAAIYFEVPSVIVIPVGQKDIRDLGDLAGKRVAVMKEDPGYDRVRRLENVFLFPVNSLSDALLLVQSGGVDALIGDRFQIFYLADDHGWGGRFKVVGKEVGHSRFGVAVSKARPELAQQLKRAFWALEKSGKQDAISNQWFGVQGAHAQYYFSNKIIRWLVVFIGASLLIAILALGWNLWLQRELDMKALAIEKAELGRTIAEEKSRFEAIVQSMTEGLMLVNLREIIEYLNAPGAQYLGRRTEDLLGQPLRVLKTHLLSQVKSPELFERRLEQLDANPMRPTVLEYTTMTTKRLDIRLKIFPVRDRQGEFAGRGILIEDITPEREVERLKSEFVSIASHELRTPMTSILGFSEIMLTQSLPAELSQRYTQQIHNEAERLTRILNDMLDITYLESGEGILKKSSLQLPELIQEVVGNFQAQLKIGRKIEVRVLGTPAPVWADRDKLTQVLWNLLSNADKYSPAGREIRLDLIERNAPSPEWRLLAEELELLLPAMELKVTDFGQGIPESQLNLIFLPFHRVETDVHTIRGTGLGLAIVKRIIEAHGGRVWARSEPGKQTEMILLLPKQRAA